MALLGLSSAYQTTSLKQLIYQGPHLLLLVILLVIMSSKLKDGPHSVKGSKFTATKHCTFQALRVHSHVLLEFLQDSTDMTRVGKLPLYLFRVRPGNVVLTPLDYTLLPIYTVEGLSDVPCS